jgi:hypothetical protein
LYPPGERDPMGGNEGAVNPEARPVCAAAVKGFVGGTMPLGDPSAEAGGDGRIVVADAPS